MGAKESKITFLPYEEAVKRVNPEELERLRDAFKRYSGNNGFLAKNNFFNDVLGELVPARLSEQLFMTCGGSSKGISFRDIIVLLVIITKGTVDEKVKFLFCLLSVDGNTVTKEDLENFYNACDGGEILPRCISEAFWRHDKLSCDDFYQWVIRNPDFSAVTRWLLEEQRENHGIKLSCEDDTPSFYHSLANITKFSETDIVELEKRYWNMKSSSKTGRFDLDTFKLNVCPPLPEQFCTCFFNYFDKNKDEHIDFKEMVTGISVCCRGLTSERLKACFEMFDVNNDGFLDEDELRTMMAGLLEVSAQYNENEFKDKFADDMLLLLPARSDKGLEMHDFRCWASTSILIHEFLLLLSQICHVIFGLKPALREEEGCIIRRWLDREHKVGLQPGLLYYIVTMSWWNTWKNYVNYENDVVTPQFSRKKIASTFTELEPDNISVHSKSSSVASLNDATSDVNSRTSSGSLTKRHNQVDVVQQNGGTKPHADPKPPGIIDNSVLLGPTDTRKLIVMTGEGGKLKQNVILMYGRDYDVLPEAIWKALFTWYGGNVALPRTVIVDVHHVKPRVELYPLELLLYRHTTPPKSNGFSLNSLGINNVMTQIFGNNTTVSASADPPQVVPPKRTLQYRASFSRKNTIKQILVFISNRLKMNIEDLRLWKIENENELFLFEEEERTVEEICLKESDHLLIEVRNRDLSWPEEMNSLVATKNFRERSNTGLLEKGATGLHNLGNTCFMNSAVQCLSNTKPLRKYFSSNIFLYELNKTNPLGMKGILAKRYGDLMCDLWSGLYRSIAPVKLRWTIGRYAPRFNGFQQHDSQELLSFLLDGLHEDVNRVHDKPYVELKDSDGRSDYEVANEAWDNHLKRNQSIIVDLFQGQLKSQVRCLHCGHVSVRFDPFTFLSLPLPMESSLHIDIPLFLLNGEQARRYGMLLPQDSNLKQLRKALAKLSGVPVKRLLITEVVGATIRSFLLDDQKLRNNLIGYMYAYEIDENADLASKSPLRSPINTSMTNGNHKHTNSNGSSQNTVSTSLVNSEKNSSDVNGTNNNNTFNNETIKIKTKRPFIKKPFKTKNHKKSPKHNVISVESTPSTATTNNSSSTTNSSCLEVPGVVNGDVSSSNSRLSSTSSAEAVCEAAHHGLVIAMNRKMIVSANYFLSWQKFRPILFGVPIVLSCMERTTNKNVYEMIWRHVSKYVTGDNFDQEKNRIYPYEVKAVDKDGSYCVWCPWYRFCRGCPIPCDDSNFGYTSTCLAIDWDPTVLHLHYQQALEKNFIEDESVSESYKSLRDPICLDKCLKDFTKEEELGEEETWYCSKCKEHRTIAKKFDIWKLPPILVIHLKRFQLVNNRWTKSNKLVKFQMKQFDPSTYLVKQKSCQNHTELNGELLRGIKRKISVGIAPSSSDNLSITDIGDPVSPLHDTSCVSVTENHNGGTELKVINVHQNKQQQQEDKQASAENGETADPEHLYNLFAISCHSGMLNGGHYITYAKNENSKWFCYNDSSCKEVDEKAVEQESPYMLFFEKCDLRTIDYMPNIKDKQPSNVQQEEDDFDKEVKKYCSIM